jgi:hypothetical protein
MGGYGSGRYGWNGEPRYTIEQCRVLSLQPIVEETNQKSSQGYLQWNDRNKAFFSIEFDENTLEVQGTLGKVFSKQLISLYVRKQYVGGNRYWLRCPVRSESKEPCNRICSKLFMSPGSSEFGCRVCHQLTYSACNTSHQRLISAKYPDMEILGVLHKMFKKQRRKNNLFIQTVEVYDEREYDGAFYRA